MPADGATPKPAWPRTQDGAFATTQWTMIAEAARDGDAESERALAKLCESYWPPVYAFIRRRGHAPEDAKDLTQGFFAYLLEKQPFAGADKTKGKFRTYLLGAVKFYLSDEKDKANAQKRGGGAAHFSIDAEVAEKVLREALVDNVTPEVLFERQWVRVVMSEAEAVLRADYVRQEKAETFDMLRPFLLDDGGGATGGSYAEIAAREGVSEGSLKTAASRLRKRYANLLKQRIAATVESPEDIDEEIGFLLAAIE